MEKKTIPLIIIAVFSISILIGFEAFAKPANAQSFVIWYNNLIQNSSLNFGTNIKMWGEGAVNTSSIIYGKPVNGISLWLSKTGNPTGNVSIGVWSNTTTPTYANVLYLIANISATTLTTTNTLYEFNNADNTHVIGLQQSIGAFHAGSTAINFVTIRSCFSSPNGCIDGRNSAVIAFRATGGGWGPPEYSFDLTSSIFFSEDGGGTGGGGSAVNGQCPVGSTALECVGSGTSPFAGITGGQNITNVVGALTDGIGLTSCGTGGDPEICGSGLFTFLFLLILTEFFSLAGYLGFSKKLNSQIQLADIGLLVLMIGFVDLAIGFYLSWIPDIIFYSIVVLIAGFLAFGLVMRFRGGQ